MQQTNWERVPLRVTLMERFDSVLYPVNLLPLLDRVPELGWVVEERIEDPEGIRTKVPKRGNLRLLMDQASRTLGVTGNDIADVIGGYRELREAARELSDYSPSVETDYVEFRYIGQVRKEGIDPTEALARWWSGVDQINELGRLLADSLQSDATAFAPYGIRFAPSGLDANRQNWAELTLAPVNTAGQARFHFDLLYRNEESEVTEGVAETADNLIERVLNHIVR